MLILIDPCCSQLPDQLCHIVCFITYNPMLTQVKQTKTVVRKLTESGKLLNQYLKLKNIGQGPYSKIKLMRSITDERLYAMKKYNLFVMRKKNKLLKKEQGKVTYTNAAQEVKTEVAILKRVKYQYIAALVEIIEDMEEEKLYLILEFCEKGEIATWSSKSQRFKLNPVLASVQQIKQCFIQLTQAIRYLHSCDIVHRDIKPQNVLLNAKGEVKVIDFGRAVELSSPGQRLKGSQGTYHFMAPEMLSEVFPQGYDGKSCDMWALGITFYAVLFEILPFYEELLIKLFQNIEKGEYSFPKKIRPEYERFVPIIKQLLSVESKARPTAEELLVLLSKLE